MGIGVLRALRPGRRAPCDGKLLDLPVLQLVRKAGEPFRRREADLHVDTPRPHVVGAGAVRRPDPGGHTVRPRVVVCLLCDARHDRAAAAHIPQNGFQARPQFGALGAGQCPRIAGQAPRTAGGLGGLGPDVPLDRGDQLLFVFEEPAAV